MCLYWLTRGDYFYTNYFRAVWLWLFNCMCCSERFHTSDRWGTLGGTCIKTFPQNEQQFKEKMLDMDEPCQFPCYWTAMDGCHTPLKCPDGGFAACKEDHNFKNFYSVVLMGLVDAKYQYVWGDCGFLGNSHDSIILQSTKLWTDITEGEAIPSITWIVPKHPTDMVNKPFNTVLMREQHYFNYQLSKARMVTKRAYGQLEKMSIFTQKWESPLEFVPMATLACIVLHNICIECRDMISRKLDLIH